MSLLVEVQETEDGGRDDHGPHRPATAAQGGDEKRVQRAGVSGGGSGGDATLIGIGFGALLLRTNALWLLVGLHALFNSGSALQGANDGGAVDAVLTLSTLPFAVYGLFLLRRVKRKGSSKGQPV